MMPKYGRILIVDDDAVCVSILHRLLEKEYELDTASTGNACLAKLITFKPHLVLLDIKMPGLNGHETCQRIKFGPMSDYVRVILISGKDTITDHFRGHDILADDRLLKPFEHEDLLDKVHNQLRLREMQIAMERQEDNSNLVELYCRSNPMNNAQQARFAAALRRLPGFSAETQES